MARALVRAKDLVDSRYAEALSVSEMARTAGWSRAHFSREFRQLFGESPYQYLLTRRLERASALLRTTDRPIARVCHDVGLGSLGSFTTSFQRMFGVPPLAYRIASRRTREEVRIPACVARAYGRPANRTFREDAARRAS